jgi:hypothetical protein
MQKKKASCRLATDWPRVLPAGAIGAPTYLSGGLALRSACRLASASPGVE